MRRLSPLAVALTLAGCSAQPPPGDAPLTAGVECVAVVPGKPTAVVPLTDAKGDLYAIGPGMECRVLDATRDDDGRITVKVLEGPDQGRIGKVARSHLVPVR